MIAASVYINGKKSHLQDARISIFDHGFLFGDSVYEVIRTYKGKLLFFDEHDRRLRYSASRIALRISISREDLRNELKMVIADHSDEESYLRIIVTRGTGPMTLDPAQCVNSSRIIIRLPLTKPPQEIYEKGYHLITASDPALDWTTPCTGIKTGNYLANAMALMEAKRQGADDALMLNGQGFITEATTSNIFRIKDGIIFTPPLGAGILEGITRQKILEITKDSGMEVHELQLSRDELLISDEVFITGTIKGVLPVTMIDSFKIGDGKPGPVTDSLMKKYEELINSVVEN